MDLCVYRSERAISGGALGTTMVGSESLVHRSQATVGKRGRAPSSAGGGGLTGGVGSNMLRRRRSPTMVLVMSLCFIGFVTALYIFGFSKLYRSRTTAASA